MLEQFPTSAAPVHRRNCGVFRYLGRFAPRAGSPDTQLRIQMYRRKRLAGYRTLDESAFGIEFEMTQQ